MSAEYRDMADLAMSLPAPHGPDHEGCVPCRRILRAMQEDTARVHKRVAEREHPKTGRSTMAETELSAALTAHRIAAGLSQNATARLVGVAPAYVSRLQRGTAHQPSRPVVLAFAEAFRLDTLETDRLLFLAGHATVVDWQQRTREAEEALARIEAALNYRVPTARQEAS